MERCIKHFREMHWCIERIAEQYTRSANGGPVVLAVVLTCEQVEDILEDVICRATGHELGHNVVPRAWMHDGSPHLACRRCGCPLTLDVEDAYREIVLHLPSHQKQGPRS